MNPIKLSSLLLSSALLIACGGGGAPNSTTATGSGDGNTTTGDGTNVSTDTEIGTPDIGTGTGNSYSDGVVTVADGGLVGGRLAAGGQVNVSIDIVDTQNANARIISKEYGVVFSSTCANTDPAKATFDDPSQVITSGTATTTYRAAGCDGSDIVTATLFNSTGGVIDTSAAVALATATIDVVPPVVRSISFVSTSATQLGIKGVGNAGLEEVANVVFVLNDVNGDPITNHQVNFALSASASSASLASTSGITNESGQVTAILNSGPSHSVVKVIASSEVTNSAGNTVTDYTGSDDIAIVSGFPVQGNMTISAEFYNPHAWDWVGKEVGVSVFMADRWGNTPPDGLRVTFVTEGGYIEPSCELSDGSCSVQWRGQNRRPGDVNNASNSLYVNDLIGFSTITAYAQGDSDYVDVNKNGAFDDGEGFVSYPEVFFDDDFDGVYDVGFEERGPDTDNDGAYSAVPVNAADRRYQGLACTDAARGAGHCATNMNIRASTRFVMAGEVATVTLMEWNGAAYVDSNDIDFTGNQHIIVLRDVNGNIPANGTSISFTAEGFEVIGNDGEVGSGLGLISAAAFPGVTPATGAVFFVGILDEDNADNPSNPTLEYTINRVENGTIKNGFPLVNTIAPPP